MTDEKILELYLARREEAIRETEVKYGGLCSSVAMNILQDREDARECLNDTLMKAWAAIPPEKPKYFGSFLARITRNLALDRLRASAAEKRGGGTVPLLLDELSECIGSGSAEEAVLVKELGQHISRFLSSLPQRDRSIFLLRYFYGERVDAIARRQAVTQNNAAAILSRTRKKLRTYLEKEGLV